MPIRYMSLICCFITLHAMDNNKTLKQVATLKGHTDEIFTLLASRKNNAHLYSASRDKTIRGWDTKKYTEKVFEGHEGQVTGLSFGDQDEQTLVSSSWDKTVRKWNIETAEQIISETFHNSIICLAQQDETLVAGGCNINLLDPKTLAICNHFGCESNKYRSISLHNDTIYAGAQNVIQEWDKRVTKEPVACYETKDNKRIDAVVFCPTKKRLYACGPNSERITICDTESKKVILSLDRSKGPAWIDDPWNGFNSFLANIGLDDASSHLYVVHAAGILEVLNTEQIEKTDENPQVCAFGTTPFDDPAASVPFDQLEAFAIDADGKQAYTAGSAVKSDGTSVDNIQVWDTSKLAK